MNVHGSLRLVAKDNFISAGAFPSLELCSRSSETKGVIDDIEFVRFRFSQGPQLLSGLRLNTKQISFCFYQVLGGVWALS
jgi:hypothetical protein